MLRLQTVFKVHANSKGLRGTTSSIVSPLKLMSDATPEAFVTTIKKEKLRLDLGTATCHWFLK